MALAEYIGQQAQTETILGSIKRENGLKGAYKDLMVHVFQVKWYRTDHQED